MMTEDKRKKMDAFEIYDAGDDKLITLKNIRTEWTKIKDGPVLREERGMQNVEWGMNGKRR